MGLRAVHLVGLLVLLAFVFSGSDGAGAKKQKKTKAETTNPPSARWFASTMAEWQNLPPGNWNPIENCTPSVTDDCSPVDLFKGRVQAAGSRNLADFWRHRLKALKAVRNSDLKQASKHNLKAVQMYRKPFVKEEMRPDGVVGRSQLCQGSTHQYRPLGDHFTALKGGFDLTSLRKVEHDLEQLEYLREQGILDNIKVPSDFVGWDTVLGLLREARTGISQANRPQVNPSAPEPSLPFPNAIREILDPVYQRLVYLPPSPVLPRSPINPNLDLASIERSYFKNKRGGYTYTDDFLVPEALAGLQKFALEATVWFDYRFSYMGAYVDDGLYSELLFQVSTDFSKLIPNVFKGRKLSGMWIYKYNHNDNAGISLHADMAFINANFWITPDSANLNKDTGGLVVWPRTVPMEWENARAQNRAELEGFIDQNKLEPVKIPYRCNRMVFFNSNLIHKTDESQFAEGYTNRRLNITMLYGQREADEEHLPPKKNKAAKKGKESAKTEL